MSDQHEAWRALQVLRPDDVPAATPLVWQAQKRSEAGERLMNLLLPADFPYDVQRGTSDDALTQLALGESMRRDIGRRRGNTIHQALVLGATWAEVSDALGITTPEARDMLRSYADGQRRLQDYYAARGDGVQLGFTADRHAEVLALTELADNEPYTTAEVSAS